MSGRWNTLFRSTHSLLCHSCVCVCVCACVCVCVCVCVCPPLRDMKCNYICPWEHFNRSVSASGKLPIQQYHTILRQIRLCVFECVFVLQFLKQFIGALCRFGEEIWIRRERSLLTVWPKLSLFSSLNKQTYYAFGVFAFPFLCLVAFLCISFALPQKSLLLHCLVWSRAFTSVFIYLL